MLSSNESTPSVLKLDEQKALYRRFAEELLDDLARRLAEKGEVRNVDGIEVLFLGLAHLLTTCPAETSHMLINETVERLNYLRPYIGNPLHCDECRETADVADHLSQKIGRVSNEAFVEGVSRVLRLFLDTIRDDDLSEDLEDRAMDNLVPDDEDEDVIEYTIH